MYIAFKWLVSFTLCMWLAMCIVDSYLEKNIKLGNKGADTRRIESIFKNIFVRNEHQILGAMSGTQGNSQYLFEKQQKTAGLHILMFIAGAAALTIFHKKYEIIKYLVKGKTATLCLRSIAKIRVSHLKKTANQFGVAISNCLQIFAVKIGKHSFKFLNYIHTLNVTRFRKQCKIHVILLNKLKEVGEERKNLGQLLIAAIHENKNIRMRYQLESMTKNRLKQHIEDIQKQIKENRTRYVSFQQLYLVTHQENNFLKARLRKLKDEKDNAEKNLMSLINEMYRSKNKELKAYCGRFIVKSKRNLLNLDVTAEIEEFLEKSRKSSDVTSTWCSAEKSNTKVAPVESWSRRASTHITEIFNENDGLVPFVSDAPKLKGLPGEYVWTVKDKNGIIEKLYEYDYESELDKSDTIKRIREYSVYFDKECLLDFSRMENETDTETSCINECCQSRKMDYHLTNQRIVSGSKAFKKFLQSNNSIVRTRSNASPTLCG